MYAILVKIIHLKLIHDRTLLFTFGIYEKQPGRTSFSSWYNVLLNVVLIYYERRDLAVNVLVFVLEYSYKLLD